MSRAGPESSRGGPKQNKGAEPSPPPGPPLTVTTGDLCTAGWTLQQMATTESNSDAYCECRCEFSQQTAQNYDVSCNCNRPANTTYNCQSFQCHPQQGDLYYDDEDHYDYELDGEKSDRPANLTDSEGTTAGAPRFKPIEPEHVQVSDLHKRSTEMAVCDCECMLTEALDWAACDCFGDDEVCASWTCSFVEDTSGKLHAFVSPCSFFTVRGIYR